jgi:hypothetical protein
MKEALWTTKKPEAQKLELQWAIESTPRKPHALGNGQP